MLLQGNTSQERNVQQDMTKVKGNVVLTKIGMEKAINKKTIKSYVNQKYAVGRDLR